MKRTLSLVLALVMILGTFTSVLAAPVNTEMQEAGELLEELKVLEGSEGKGLMLEDALRRRDAVILLSRLMGEEEVAAEFPGGEDLDYNDLENADPLYLPFFAWAKANETFLGHDGHEGVRFGYDEEMTTQQYLNVLLRVLGYDVEYAEVMETAVEVGLVEKALENNAIVTRGTMALMTVEALNTTIKDSDETLAEKLDIEMPVDEPEVLEVDEVVAANLKEVKVMFNKEVDVDLEDAELFSINKGITVSDVVLEDNVLILSVNKMTNKADYKLVVKGTEEVDGTYDFKAYDNEVPYVVDVQALGTKAIKVTLSEPVQTVKSTNFRLNGKTLYAGVPVDEGKEIILRPYTELSIGEHDLTVTGLKDYHNFVSVESNHTFVVAEDTDAPTVVDVSATLERVVVEFSEDVDPNTVNSKSVYWMEGSVKRYSDKAVALAGNKFAFEFTTHSLPVYETTVYITGVKDYSGNTMVAAEVPVKAVIDETRPEVVSAELDTDLKTVIVKFNKPVKTDDKANSALELDNYRVLDDKDNKILINEIVEKDNKTFKVVLGTTLSANKSYTIKVSGIQDRNKYANTMYDYNGNIAVGVVGLPKIESFSGKHTPGTDENVNEITILFSRAMDLATVVDPANYIVKIGGAIKPLAEVDGYVDVIKGDGSLIKVFVRGEDVKAVTEIAVLGVKDTNGKLLSDYGDMKVFTDTNTLAIVTDKVIAVAKDKIKVTFTQQVEKADKSIFTVGGIEVTKVEGLDSKTLTLTLDTKLNSNVTVGEAVEKAQLKVDLSDKKVVSSLGEEFEDIDGDYAIIDEIAPEFEKAVATAVYDTVTITLTFDEELVIGENLVAAAEKDITVTRIDGTVKKKFEITELGDLDEDNNYSTKTFNLVIKDETVDSAYTVSIKKDSDWLQDKDGNSVVEKTRRTNKAEGLKPIIEAVVKAEASKTQADVDAAQALVDELFGADFKAALQERIDAVQEIINEE